MKIEKKPEQVATEEKIVAMIQSCKTCEHFENAKNYLDLFKVKFNDEYTHRVLLLAMNYRQEKLDCKKA